MELKKSAKIRKNEKTQHLIRCFNPNLDVLSPKSNSKLIFRIFVIIFLAFILNKKWQKTKLIFSVFCYFLKNCEFWSKFDITNVFLVKFPF